MPALHGRRGRIAPQRSEFRHRSSAACTLTPAMFFSACGLRPWGMVDPPWHLSCTIRSRRRWLPSQTGATPLERTSMQLNPVSATTAAQSSQILSLFQQNSPTSQTANTSSQAAQFNQWMNQLDCQSGSTVAPTSTTPTSGTPTQTPVHHHHGHHRGSATDVANPSPANTLSAMLSQSGNLAQSALPASMTTNTTALDPTSIFGA